MGRRQNVRWLVSGLFVCAVTTGVVWGRTISVDVGGGGECTSIQAAIDVAVDGDEIKVAPGTYYEAINFNRKAIRLYSSDGPEVTTIDGSGHYHVVQCVSREDTNTILEGFTITGGEANGTDSDKHGGGMYNDKSSPTVTHCIFTGNSAFDRGGGMCNSTCSPTVSDCTFSGNSAGNGGGMFNANSNPTVTNCTFNVNSVGTNGGGIYNYGYSNPILTNCRFSGNSAVKYGGGVRNYNSSPTVTDCIFIANNAEDGGGIYNYRSNPTVTNCCFNNNSAESRQFGALSNAGGMFNEYSSPTLTNCIFCGNSADLGGAMYNLQSSPTLTNCTFSGNVAFRGGGMYCENGSLTVTNCILWEDVPEEICDNDSSITVTYSDVHGGWPGAGNIDILPIFVDAATDDIRLTWYSPCVDAGDSNTPGLPETDLAGNPRVADGDWDGNAVVDMGALEMEPVGVGTLEVTIESNEVINAGAMWKIKGGEQWYNSGEVIVLAPGYHQIELCELPDWAEPEKLLVGYETVDSNNAPQQSFWVRVIADLHATVTTEYKPLPVFDIGQIPPRDAPHGRRLEFHVDANWLGDDILFSFITTFDPNYPEPEGPILIDPVSGLFTYEPNEAYDRTAFTVTFRAESGIDANEQTVTITPIPDLPLEYEILSRPVQPLPDPNGYVFVNEILSDSNEYLNGEYRQVRSVTVAGIDITIQNSVDNLVYMYHENLDIKDLTIFAETVTIRDSLHLPQTDLTLYARNLYFEDDDGDIIDINTTPVDFRPPAEKKDGLPAGNINLYIESYHAGLNGRLTMNGTKGYNGGRCGDDGVLSCTFDSGQPMAWLSPYALKMVIAHARDAYLYRYTAETHDILHEYAVLLNTYRALPQWNSLTEQWQFEFEQMHQEVISLLHRIENGLDYFGNPPDWVPALSFEVLYTAYDKEIDHAIRVMYLSYWLQNKATDILEKAAALSNYRSRLWDDTVQAKKDYVVVNDLIDPLKTRADRIADRIGRADPGGCYGLLCHLKDKEADLLEQAEEDVHKANEVPWWKTALQTISVVGTSMISGASAGSGAGPEGTAAGALGGWAVGMINVYLDDSIMDPNPWPEASMRTDVAKQFSSIDFDQVTEGWRQDFNDIEDLKAIETGGVSSYLQNLEENAEGMAAGLWDVKEALKATSLDNEEVEAKLKEIKAADPTFDSLVDEVTELMVEKQLFNTELAAAMQKISTLANSMTNNVLAIDAMNRDISYLNRIVDPRALVYIKDMEQRALARLQKYHYYLAKAYEYRLLEPYRGDLGIDKMFEKIKEIAAAPLDPETDNGYLGPEDFEALKVVYEKQLKELTNHILNLFLSGRTEESVPTWFEISDPEELSLLNAGEPLTINLFERGLFPSDKENIRIVRMQVEDDGMDVSLTGDCTGFGQIVINMQHPAVSEMQYFQQLTPGTGNIYRFRHLAEDTKELLDIHWQSEYNIINGQLSHPRLSASHQSLLWMLLDELGRTGDALIFSRPGGRADIRITKRDNLPRPAENLPPCQANIEYLLVRVEYDYYEKKEELQTLRVVTEPIFPPGSSSYELMPYFLVNTPDVCGRQDGRGNFYRIYNIDLTREVTVTAPATYGNWRFDKWTDKQGYTLGRGLTLEIEFLPSPNDNPTVWAEYVY